MSRLYLLSGFSLTVGRNDVSLALLLQLGIQCCCMNMFNSHALYITYTVLNMYPLQVIGLALFVFSIIEGQMSCIQAQSQLSKGAPATCNDVLASGDIFNMRDEKITTFCVDNDCPKILLPIYKSIAEACGGGGVRMEAKLRMHFMNVI